MACPVLPGGFLKTIIMKYPINTLKEALYELRYPSLNECKKEWENRRRWQSELKQAIELLKNIEL